MTTTLYRAADDDYLSRGYSLTADREVAETYTDNPGFGGSTIWTCEAADDAAILDMRGLDGERQIEALEEALEGHDDAAALARVCDERYPLCETIHAGRAVYLLDALAERYDWILLDESYPEQTTTWLYLERAEVELVEVED